MLNSFFITDAAAHMDATSAGDQPEQASGNSMEYTISLSIIR